MKYLKIFTNFAEKIELLGDTERGRLFTAMLMYAEDGTEIELKGNEKFLWNTAKQEIDRQNEAYEKKVSGAAKAREKVSDIRDNQKKNSDIRKKILISSQEKEKEKDKEKDKEKKEENITPYISPLTGEIVAYLNQKTGLNYKPTTRATVDKIKARLNEGYLLDDFKKVIDNKCAEWLNTDMAKYLRPETLFGPKFESYLNTPVRKEEETEYQRYQRELREDKGNWSAW